MLSPLRFIRRVLCFQFTADELSAVGLRHLAVGLVFTWAAGIGRYWDSPRAHILQRLGLGSIAYVLVLSAFVWLLLKPLRPSRWSYLHLLTFVAAVSPPALLYAIPVERFMSLDHARAINFWFLAVVAVWRVALYIVFLRRYAGFTSLRLIVSIVLPLSVIVAGLTALNLERAVFEIMAGNDRTAGTSSDSAYGCLFLLTVSSVYISPFVVILYLVAVYLEYRDKSNQTAA